MVRALGWLVALALLVCASASAAAGAPIAEATKEQWSAAQTTFKVGDDLYDAGRYAEAITAYRASYDIVASPNSRLMIARALRELGKRLEARAEFEATLGEARDAQATDAKYTSTVEAAEAEKAALESQLGRVVLQPPDGVELSAVELNGHAVEAQSWTSPVWVMPGTVEVSARDQSGQTTRQELTVSAGEERRVPIEFRVERSRAPAFPPPPKSGREPERTSLRPFSYVAAGVGVVGLVTFGVFGALNNSKHGELEDSCPDDRCAPGSQDDIDSGRRYQLLANVGLAVGVVGLGAGVTLFLLDEGSKESARSRSSRRNLAVDVGAGRVGLRGRF